MTVIFDETQMSFQIDGLSKDEFCALYVGVCLITNDKKQPAFWRTLAKRIQIPIEQMALVMERLSNEI